MADPSPILVDASGMRVTVIGGGKVALRKCLHFPGADIRVVSESAVPGMEDIASDIVRTTVDQSNVGPLISGSDLVIAATDDKDVNDMVCAKAKELGIWVNSAHGSGSVIIPSVLERDGYRVSVSTNGTVPAFPPFLVECLDRLLDGRFDSMYRLLRDSRARIAGKGTQPERSELLRRIARDGIVSESIEAGDTEAAERRAMEMEADLC